VSSGSDKATRRMMGRVRSGRKGSEATLVIKLSEPCEGTPYALGLALFKEHH
jgi:hypothetical protein